MQILTTLQTGKSYAVIERNNVDAASEVLAKHETFIRRVISNILKDEKEKDETIVDDIFQDFFLSLVYKPVPADVKDLRGYLYKTIIHDIVDATRRIERYQAVIAKYREQLDFPIDSTFPDNTLITEEELNELLEIVKRQLPDRECQAITLRYGNCLSVREIAEKMLIDSRSVSRYISEGLKKMRCSLQVRKGNLELEISV